MGVVVDVTGGRLLGGCLTCGASVDFPDTELGRATLDAWKTRHQHAEVTP